MRAKSPLIINNLNLSIDGNHILKDVNLTIPNNKIICIVGPSGCGKSTLLKTLNRLIDDTEGVKYDGEILIRNKNLLSATGSDLIELRRRIGLVPQRPCPLPMSIYDNVAYGPKIHGLCKTKAEYNETVRHYLELVGLWDEVKDRLNEPARKLSIGQQQRLCLARSLAVRPDFILADEATSALDPVSSKKIEDMFLKLKEDYTIIMVTHTLRQARRIADHAIFIYFGEIIEQGDAKELFNNPKEELTKKYLSGVFS